MTLKHLEADTAAFRAGRNEDAARAEFWRGGKDTLPVLAGVVPLAMVLGAQASQKGLSSFQVALMTGLNFAGGSEFAAIRLWDSPLPILVITAVTLLINSRHILMGAALAAYVQHLPRRKALPALFFMCDESWAVSYADTVKRAAAGKPVPFSIAYYLRTSFACYVVWVGFATTGAFIGPFLGDVEAYGFGMASPAVFLVLLRGMWKRWRAAAPWLVSLLVAALTHLVVPGAWYVLAGATSGLAAGYCLGSSR